MQQNRAHQTEAIVVPIWPSTRRSLKMNDVMVKANTKLATVTTDPRLSSTG